MSKENLLFLKIFSRETGRNISIKSLDKVGDTLTKLGCSNITIVSKEGKTDSVEWTIDYFEPFLFGRPRHIVPRTLAIKQSDNGSLMFSCKYDLEEIKTGKDGCVTPLKEWIGETDDCQGYVSDSNERLSPTIVVFYFLNPFVSEKHTPLARTDVWGFQFLKGDKPKDKEAKARIGGVTFTLTPDKKQNTTLGGKLKIELPKTMDF